MPADQPHATLRKFGYPGTLVHEGKHWAVLVRPAQATLGALVLCARSEAMAYGDLPAEAFAEQAELVPRIEQVLRTVSHYEKINYLMLMMVDPHVHFHIIPRYPGSREFGGEAFPDSGWPGLPDLKSSRDASANLVINIRKSWQAIS